MLKRKESNVVHNDLTFLEGIGFLELEEYSNGCTRRPVVCSHAPQIGNPKGIRWMLIA